jgi:hypothetical protein
VTRAAFTRAVGVCFALSASALHAQTVSEGEVAHWAYASFFGTGWYNIDGGGEVYAVRVRPGWTWRESDIDSDGNRSLGIQFRLPMTLGLHKLDFGEIGEALDLDNASAISFVPGVEIEIPINERWTLKPIAYAGWGTELGHSNYAWIYWAGLKSRFAFKSGDLDWALINSLSYVGYSPSVGDSADVVPFLTALEFERPMGNVMMGGNQVFLNWHVAYTKMLDDPGLQLGFQSSGTTFTSENVADQWELGIAFSKGRERLRWWLLSVDRVGLTYKASSNGDFEGIAITFSSIFDR